MAARDRLELRPRGFGAVADEARRGGAGPDRGRVGSTCPTSGGRSTTADHYEILGVGRDASHDVVKRAYLDQALRFHPDRQHDRSEAAKASAAYRMREVNEAWSVLRSPGTRAHYDDQLRAAAASPVPGAGPGPSSSRGAGAPASTGSTATRNRTDDLRREPEVADLDRDDGRVPSVRRTSPWRMFAPVILGGVVLAAILIATAYAQEDTPGVGVRTVEEFAVGTCVVVGFGPALATERPAEQAREAVVAVPCGQTGARTIIDRVPFPKPCPRGSSAQLMADTRDSLCLR